MTRWVGILGVAVLALVMSLAPAEAFPVGTTCGASATNADGISKSDVTFRGNNADDCFGLQGGNINAASDLNTAVPSWGGDYIIADQTGGSFTTADGINWTLTSDSIGSSGNWTLAFSAAPDVSKTYDIVLAIKAANAWSAWLFNDELVSTDDSGNGTWTIHWAAAGGGVPCPPTGPCTPPGLSHMIAFIGPGVATGSDQQTGSDQVETGNDQLTGSDQVETGNEQVPPVPGPAPLVLLGLGLVGLAIGGLRLRR